MASCAPAVFVMEYYKDVLWKGSLIFWISLVTSIFYFKTKQVGARFLHLQHRGGPHHSLPLREWVAAPCTVRVHIPLPVS